MRSDSPSQTAMATAFIRALHLVVDDAPYVFEDSLAAEFLPAYQRRFLKRLAALPRSWSRVFRQRRSGLGRMRAQVLVRARYAEDALHFARASAEVSRYVVLAAGLDTFAWRQPSGDAVPVVEIDHPATQRWKRDHLQNLGWQTPEELTFLPVDFEAQSLDAALDKATSPQVISWLGTTYYLQPAAVAATLTTLAANSPPGSRLVLDYWQETALPEDGGALLWGTRIATALQMEPMHCFFEPADFEALAHRTGWRVRANLSAAEQNRRYLQGRRDDLQVPGFAWLAELER
jgi:methyltransferase (TIGR00027 family)